MRKLLLLLLLLCSGIAGAQIINIPDNNFRNRLLAASTTNAIAKNSSGASIKIDTNNDAYIQQSEANAVYELDVTGSAITNMTGIQSFTNLEVLNCSANNITTLTLTGMGNLETVSCGLNINMATLTVSGLSNLRGLYCSGNNLSYINFAGLAELRWLECSNNSFDALDVTPLSGLRELDCSGNILNSLTVTNLPDLSVLDCGNNYLSALNLAGLDHLETLRCNQNYLTALDFTGLDYLQRADCSENQLATLDFSGCPAFIELDCSQNNNLTYINIKNGATQVYNTTTAPNNWSGNPSLQFVCIDESEDALVGVIVGAYGLTVNFNEYCTFVPGGDYNTITGVLLFDGNGNGCNGDIPQPFIKIGIDGPFPGSIFSNEAGGYSFYTLAGTFSVTPELENESFFTVTPVTESVTFPIVDNSVVTNNFCIAPNGTHPDVEVVIAPLMPAVPGGRATYKIVYKNKGNQVVSGSVTLSCDITLIDYAYVNPFPDNVVPGTYTWNFTGLRPFENREINVALDINSSTDTPPVNIGQVLQFSSVITANSGDDLPADNAFVLEQKAVDTFNPNNIVCIEGDSESPAAIGGYLHYAVNFKNTGTEPIANVVVKHDIDPAQFDAGSVEVLNGSHAMRVAVAGNKVEFMMQNANLSAADHGNILFKVKTKPSLVQGATVTNHARIFFDYDFPVQTNYATTTFETLSRGDFEKDNSIKVYPNPANGIVTITADSNLQTIQLFDVQGRLLETGIINDMTTTVDLSARAAGMYFVKVTTDKGSKVEKVVKE